MRNQPTTSKERIEDLIERKVTDILASKALDQSSHSPQSEISEEVQQRLKLLKQKAKGQRDGRERDLSFLLYAKQYIAHGKDVSALKTYMLAKDLFSDNKKLEHKMKILQDKMQFEKEEAHQ